MTVLEAEGIRLSTKDDSLYSEEPAEQSPTKIVAIPYYAWGNRETGEMRVWIHEK
jgi:DUF1680 family protein